jgi:hypothetical protein
MAPTLEQLVLVISGFRCLRQKTAAQVRRVGRNLDMITGAPMVLALRLGSSDPWRAVTPPPPYVGHQSETVDINVDCSASLYTEDQSLKTERNNATL